MNYGLSVQVSSDVPHHHLCHQLVAMTSRLNWLLCRVIMQACKASKHAMFSFSEADVGGVRMGKNA